MEKDRQILTKRERWGNYIKTRKIYFNKKGIIRNEDVTKSWGKGPIHQKIKHSKLVCNQ